MKTRSMFYGATPRVFERAAMLRRNETKGEKLLWQKLSKSQLDGFRFKRQHPISNYIVDFYCHKCKLVIEVDEQYHNRSTQKNMDENRDKVLFEQGLTVLRFSERDIVHSLDSVVNVIKRHLLEKR